MKIGINGFGRIGRLVTRAYFDNEALQKNVEIVAINDLASPEEAAFGFKYDSVHRQFNGEVKAADKSIIINGKNIKHVSCPNAAEIPWKDLGVDVVLECSGRYADKESASLHLKGGAKKVIISAPGKGVDRTIVFGVNHKEYSAANDIVLSNASCTTNCLAPVVSVIHEKFGIAHGLMTTIHSYTNDQRLVDAGHKDPRRARAGAINMIPTTTGAAKTVGEVIPSLKGKLDGYSVRVPTPDVSLTDVVFSLNKEVSVEEVNAALTEAANGRLKGVLAVCNEPLVSTDFTGNTHSSIVDSALTYVVGGNEKGKGSMVKICAWYDNEYGFSCRMLDLCNHIANSL
ncbi:MAG: type I glyceraldehyde-3-phosphate dehydrogenase [Bdellovibrionota bacterium]